MSRSVQLTASAEGLKNDFPFSIHSMKKYLTLMLACFMLLGSGWVWPAEKKLNIVFIPKSSDQVFWDLMRDGVERAIREDGGQINLTWRGPAYNDDTVSQLRILDAYTRPDVDAIIITPTDRTRLVEPVGQAVRLGIKVIVVDSGLDGHHHQHFVSTDNYASGQLAARQLAARQLAELMGQRGRVLLLRTVAGSASTDDRASGFIDYLKAHAPGMSIAADVYGGGSAGKVRHSVGALLKKSANFDGIFAVNESTTDGMLRALREAGLAGRMRFIGFDSTPFLLESLEKKELDGLIVQDPNRMGYLAIQAAVAAIRNQPIKDSIIYTDTTLVTRANSQRPEIKKLMCVRC
jgi:ribose transport system substrate-binding protein